MPSNNNYLSYERFSEVFPILRRVNCAATSFIRENNLEHKLEILSRCCSLDPSKEIGEAYLSKADELQQYTGYNRTSLKRITFDEFHQSSANEFRLVYGFQKRTVVVSAFGFSYEEEMDDYHVIVGVRHNTGEVRWYHKFGKHEEMPREVTPEDWVKIWRTYITNPIPALFEFNG